MGLPETSCWDVLVALKWLPDAVLSSDGLSRVLKYRNLHFLYTVHYVYNWAKIKSHTQTRAHLHLFALEAAYKTNKVFRWKSIIKFISLSLFIYDKVKLS